MQSHDEYVAIFKALADETRLKIVEMLSCGELCACDILESFKITQPTLSYHMKILTECGLVKSRKDGSWIKYTNNVELVGSIKIFWDLITTDKENCICKNAKKNVCKPKVAFICVHNSCRSQIAEALGKLLASDVFESYSAGTELKDHINPDAVRLMKKSYGIDMEETQHNKLIQDIPKPDIVITMGCNVNCPVLPCKRREDWGLEDPSGKSDEAFMKIIEIIEGKIKELKSSLASFEI